MKDKDENLNEETRQQASEGHQWCSHGGHQRLSPFVLRVVHMIKSLDRCRANCARLQTNSITDRIMSAHSPAVSDQRISTDVSLMLAQLAQHQIGFVSPEEHLKRQEYLLHAFSSLPSPQSLTRSHTQSLGLHKPLSQENWSFSQSEGDRKVFNCAKGEDVNMSDLKHKSAVKTKIMER